MRIELTREEFIDAIESIFKNTERIHGKSDCIDWIKLASHKTATYLERMDNTFSGQTPPKDSLVNLESYSKTEREYTFGEEAPLELRICTRCGKEFKSNVDCPICPSCYL